MQSVLLIGVLFIIQGYSQLINPLAPHINDNDVLFFLYNRDNQLEPIRITKHNLNDLDSNRSIKVIIHGFFENARRDWYRNMTREYLKKDDYNIIQVDWSKPASSSYSASASNTRPVGVVIGDLISALYKYQDLPLKNVHIIGHSLGAQVAGHAGKEIIKQTGVAVGRITALDAAAPLFGGAVGVLTGLSKQDAEIVDAIHTDAGFFGRKDPIGTIDFFPNGGAAPQPGCVFKPIKLPALNYIELASEVFCSHTKSHSYFISSINKETFVATKCDTWVHFLQNNCKEQPQAIMGDDYSYSENVTGLFFLGTKSSFPYAQN